MSSWSEDSDIEPLQEKTLTSVIHSSNKKSKKKSTASEKNSAVIKKEITSDTKTENLSFLELLDSEEKVNETSLDAQARDLLQQEKVFLQERNTSINAAYNQGLKKLIKIGNRLKKHNAIQGKGLIAAALLIRRLSKLENRIHKLTDNRDIISDFETLKNSVLEISGLPRVYVLEPRTLRMLSETSFKPTDKNESSFEKIHMTSLSSLHERMTEAQLTHPNQAALKNMSRKGFEISSPSTRLERIQRLNKRTSQSTSDARKRMKVTAAPNPIGVRLLNQDMIDRAKKGSTEICDTGALCVQFVHERREYQNEKDSYRYIDLAYDDKNIKNSIRLKIDVELDGSFKHWAILKEGTKFWMKKCLVWNKTKKLEFGPVTLGLMKNTKIYYLEEQIRYSPEDMKKWWKDYTDQESSSEEQEYLYA